MKSHPTCVFVGKASFKEDLLQYDTANGGMVQDGSIEMVTMINAALLVYVTRSYAALRAADLDWIIGPGYSLSGYNWRKTMKNKPGTIRNHEKP